EITRELATYLAGLTYDDLPPPVVAVLKSLLLDTLGTTLAANTLGTGCPELVDLVRGWGGAPEATLLGFGAKVPAPAAALANGGLGHALNYDAVGAGHLGCILAAPLAAAELAGKVSGKDFLAGLAAGTELVARIATASRRTGNRALEGQLLGYFGAAAAASRMFSVSPDQMHGALGLALMQAGGSHQIVLDGDPPAKAIYAAFLNHAGILSALLSKRGVGAACAAIEGEAGLFQLFYEGRFDQDVLLDGLGEQFHLLHVNFKPWPTSGIAHPFIEAALELHERVQLDQVSHVHIQAGEPARDWLEPVAERKRPANAASAANSIFFAVAKALTNGGVTLGDFTPSGLEQPDALALAERMDHSIEENLGSSAVVEVTDLSNERHTRRVDRALGHHQRPMSHTQLVEKFRDCAGYAASPIGAAPLNAVVETIEKLEDIPDVGELIGLVSNSAR
ncbi:MAG TPA: MmgE/PrpD family protein, partial [Chloroflexota bacterium]|nr:MmgE/PrpD family protein [Chloroflexota bacterium]